MKESHVLYVQIYVQKLESLCKQTNEFNRRKMKLMYKNDLNIYVRAIKHVSLSFLLQLLNRNDDSAKFMLIDVSLLAAYHPLVCCGYFTVPSILSSFIYMFPEIFLGKHLIMICNVIFKANYIPKCCCETIEVWTWYCLGYLHLMLGKPFLSALISDCLLVCHSSTGLLWEEIRKLKYLSKVPTQDAQRDIEKAH
ncbi:hypothetical protein FF38_03509 [Lucilia cuprina]|uniref:Uncharacterized protein n=1 Tax=Lucilia cuprina TaxID=7375 RepID=A0A0L0CIB6_LUCCU|nr:hypothetical protein FF38_03509 [Lucilia cuprina]